MNPLEHFGKYLMLLARTVSKPEKFSMYWKECFRQMNEIGIGSLVLVSVIAVFMGAVTAVQFAYQLQDSFIPQYYIGFIVRDMMIIEMAPTLSGLVLCGKVGSSIATELGTMRISEQIDALEIMGVNTAAYLIMPKVVAAILIVPFLVIIAAAVGITGGLLATVASGIPPDTYIRGLHSWFVPFNVKLMIIKSVVFAFIITSIACYQGYYASGGALEIGKASTRAVVIASIAVIASDYFIAELLL